MRTERGHAPVAKLHAFLAAMVTAAALSACQKAEFDRDYRLTRGDERIFVRFEEPPPYVPDLPNASAYVSTCPAIVVGNDGREPVELDLFVFQMVQEKALGGLETIIKVFVRDAPTSGDNSLVAPIGKNAVVLGSWPVREVEVAPGSTSMRCFDSFVNLRGQDMGFSIEWLKQP